jgi:transcriptional regulator with XRE-family HTH domain
MNIQERIFHLRKTLLNITQKEFAMRINMSRPNFVNIEKGRINVTERAINDICREFSVRREWLVDGDEPIFVPEIPKASNRVAALYDQLSEDNQKYAQGYMQRLLEEQNALSAAFADDTDLTDEEISLLRQMLSKRRRQKSE